MCSSFCLCEELPDNSVKLQAVKVSVHVLVVGEERVEAGRNSLWKWCFP